MSIDVFPRVFVEQRHEGKWRPFDVKSKRFTPKAAPFDVRQDLSPAAYVALMDACIAACPNGAAFSDPHEVEFERFAESARARAEGEGAPIDEDHLFGAGALSVKKLRTLARGDAPDGVEPAVWAEARAELARWADTIATAGGERVTYWFEVD